MKQTEIQKKFLFFASSFISPLKSNFVPDISYEAFDGNFSGLSSMNMIKGMQNPVMMSAATNM